MMVHFWTQLFDGLLLDFWFIGGAASLNKVVLLLKKIDLYICRFVFFWSTDKETKDIVG